MAKTTLLTALAASLLGSGIALASDRAPVEPSAPSLIRELGQARTATIGGTVVALGRDGHLTLADSEDGRITVDAEHLRLDGLAPGQAITVTGQLDDGELEAGHAIREDGSVVVRDAGSEKENDQD